jgi:hypothetical protein
MIGQLKNEKLAKALQLLEDKSSSDSEYEAIHEELLSIIIDLEAFIKTLE